VQCALMQLYATGLFLGTHKDASKQCNEVEAATFSFPYLLQFNPNFPSVSIGKRVVHLPGANAPDALAAILTVFPLDASPEPAAFTMAVVGDPRTVPEPVAAFAAVLAKLALADAKPMVPLERHAFYERARRAFVVVRTGELRKYGNLLLVKGVVNRYDPP